MAARAHGLTSVFDATERHRRADTPEGDVAIPMTDEERDVLRARLGTRRSHCNCHLPDDALKIIMRGAAKEDRMAD